jgi:hypothetical protein
MTSGEDKKKRVSNSASPFLSLTIPCQFDADVTEHRPSGPALPAGRANLLSLECGN